MNVFTANDLQAADLLALAGQGRHAIPLAGTGQVAAGQGTIRAVRLEARGWSADAQRYLPAHGARPASRSLSLTVVW